MDGDRFDDLSRRFAAGISRRGAVKVAAAGLLGALGLRKGTAAQVSVTECPNEFCKDDPSVCPPSCVCCLYRNSRGKITNHRCLPPKFCAPANVVCPNGQVFDPARRACVTPSNSTTVRPTTTTTTTTARPTTTTTTRPTTTTTRPTTTTTTTTVTTTPATTTPPCESDAAACLRQGIECGPTTNNCGQPVADCGSCDDGIDCTDDYCTMGRCESIPVDFLCGGPTNACELVTCDPARGGCVREARVCPGGDFDCVRGVCDPGSGCFLLPDETRCPVPENACDLRVCGPNVGCTTQPLVCPIPAFAASCYDTFCDRETQTCQSVPDNTVCPESPDKYNCLDPVCGPLLPNGSGGCGFQSRCGFNQICTTQFVVGGSCVSSGPQ